MEVSSEKRKAQKFYFLGCFGYSSSVQNQELKLSSSADDKLKRKRQSSCFSLKRFRKKPSAARTVPVEITAGVSAGAEELNGCKEICVAKMENKVSVKRRTEKSTVNVQMSPVNGQPINSNKFNKTRYENHEEIILGKSKSVGDNTGHTTCKNGTSRSFATIKMSAPQDKHEITRKKVDKVHEKKDKNIKNNNNNNDAIMGMSILMVTLIIMLFWGKLCAILCTSAWVYFLPKFRAKHNVGINNVGISNVEKIDDKEVDVNSMEYKKKVVMNGFLERNHIRNGVGF